MSLEGTPYRINGKANKEKKKNKKRNEIGIYLANCDCRSAL